MSNIPYFRYRYPMRLANASYPLSVLKNLAITLEELKRLRMNKKQKKSFRCDVRWAADMMGIFHEPFSIDMSDFFNKCYPKLSKTIEYNTPGRKLNCSYKLSVVKNLAGYEEYKAQREWGERMLFTLYGITEEEVGRSKFFDMVTGFLEGEKNGAFF